MSERDHVRAFRSELRNLERAVGEPVVPGEVAPWCETVGAHLRSVRDALRPLLDAHASAYRSILETNLEMSGPVERLKADDEVSEEAFAVFAARVRQARRATSHDDSSAEPFDEMTALRDEMLTRIARARAHEREVDHWMVEASLRDSGLAD